VFNSLYAMDTVRAQKAIKSQLRQLLPQGSAIGNRIMHGLPGLPDDNEEREMLISQLPGNNEKRGAILTLLQRYDALTSQERELRRRINESAGDDDEFNGNRNRPDDNEFNEYRNHPRGGALGRE